VSIPVQFTLTCLGAGSTNAVGRLFNATSLLPIWNSSFRQNETYNVVRNWEVLKNAKRFRPKCSELLVGTSEFRCCILFIFFSNLENAFIFY